MGRNSKWIEAQAEDAVECVAGRALAARLERLWYFLGRAVRRPRDETENVHQLRVFSRRTASTLETFEEYLPSRRGAWIRKQVKRIRKSAGEARDLDVLALRWHDRRREVPSAAALILDEIAQRRRLAQKPIQEIHAKLKDKGFERRAQEFLKRIRPARPSHSSAETSSVESFGAMAHRSLSGLLGPFLHAAQSEMSDAAALHAFRIEGKRVRYAMEVFAGAMDEDFRQVLYPLVAELQDRLGAINDHVTALAHMARWHREVDSHSVRESLEAGIAHEEQELTADRDAFLAWWSAEHRLELQRRFAPYVASLDLRQSAG